MDENKSFFDNTADQYAEGTGIMAREKANRLEMALTYLPQPTNKRFLDVGVGNGELLDRVSEDTQREVVGVDISRKMLEQSLNKKTELCQADANELPFVDNSFGSVSCLGVLGYVGDPEQVIHEITRVTSPYGWMAISFGRSTSPARALRHFIYDSVGDVYRRIRGKKRSHHYHRSGD